MIISDIQELYFIAHIENIPSIIEHGILCHNIIERLPYVSIAMEKK